MVAIVGYTNAGKSTLLNTLTGASVLAEDKLFATLDTRSRRVRLPVPTDAEPGSLGREIVLVDTVGFIRDLPEDLFAAFRATFEEAADADVLVHVIDANDPAKDDHLRTTELVLSELGLEKRPRVQVYNKGDLLPAGVGERMIVGKRDAHVVSAIDRESARAVLAAIGRLLGEEHQLAEVAAGDEAFMVDGFVIAPPRSYA